MKIYTIRPFLKNILAALGGGALLLLPLGAATVRAEPPQTAQTSVGNSSDSERLAQRVIPPLRTRQPVRASLGQVEPDSVSVTLTNNSPGIVTYQSTTIPTDTLELMPGEQQTFDDINAPFTLVFYQKDGDLISAEVTDVNRQEDSFEVEFNSAPTLGEDERSVVLLESGNIYLY